MAMDVEAEIRNLTRRGSAIAEPFGVLARQIKTLHEELLAFQTRTEQRFDEIDRRFDKLDGGLDRSEGRVDRLDGSLRGLRRDIAKIVGDAMREVLREERRKK
jgi:hypothetical protein